MRGKGASLKDPPTQRNFIFVKGYYILKIKRKHMNRLRKKTRHTEKKKRRGGRLFIRNSKKNRLSQRRSQKLIRGGGNVAWIPVLSPMFQYSNTFTNNPKYDYDSFKGTHYYPVYNRFEASPVMEDVLNSGDEYLAFILHGTPKRINNINPVVAHENNYSNKYNIIFENIKFGSRDEEHEEQLARDRPRQSSSFSSVLKAFPYFESDETNDHELRYFVSNDE